MINTDYIVLEDATMLADKDLVCSAGQPLVQDDTTGALKLAADGGPVVGLSKGDKNSYRDETFGEYGAYGSRKLTVIVMGRVTIGPSVYQDTDGGEVTVEVYDKTKTYKYMDKLYVKSGLITNDAGEGANTEIGYCVKPPTATDKEMALVLGKKL